MKLVVVGGHSRDIGKTAVVTGIIRGLKSLRWTAVKTSVHAHGLETVSGKPVDVGAMECALALTEEDGTHGRGDSGRFFAAGARRSLWLRAQPGRLAEAVPALKQALDDDPFVIIESTSILSFLKPAAHLVVLDSARSELKPCARRFLARADALVLDARAWRAIDAASLRNKPVFSVSRRHHVNLELCRFIRRKLRLVEGEPFTGGRATQP